MLICVGCKKEMRCEKTGAPVHYGYGHVYAGDAYSCPVCGAHVVLANDRPYHDQDYAAREYYVEMEERHDDGL